jgi:ubiquinone/menaquinone biosynthesis C-methylase UbiE
MLALASFRTGCRVLDVGTGTGVLALAAAQHLGPGTQVTAIDLSEGMLSSASANAEAAGLSGRVHFQREDAEAMTIPGASFDGVLSLYALFHLPNPQRAIDEMFRVLVPGGRLVLAVGSGPPLLSRAGAAYLFDRLPFLIQHRRGRWLSAPQLIDELVDRFLPAARSHEEAELAGHRKHGASAALLPKLLAKSGFIDVKCRARAYLGFLPDPGEYYEMQSTFSSKARKRLADAAPEDVALLRAEFENRCRSALSRGGRLTYPYAAFVVTATRP